MTSTKKVSDLRIVLLGKTGSGKSATGNTILGRNAFEVVDLIKSASKLCEKQGGVVGGKTVSVIDTPGLFNTAVTKQQLKTDLQKCVSMSAPGPHVFLLVLKLGVRFTKEERDTVKRIQENFGKDALCRTVILFTHADQLKGKTLEEYIRKSDHLQEIVDSCGGRYHSFNNEDRNTRGQVTELLKKINTIKQTNEVSHYTIEMFEKAQMARKETKIKSTIIALAVAVVFVICIWNFYTLTPPQLEKLPAQEKNLQKKTPFHLQKELSSQLQEKDSTCSISSKYYYYHETNRSSRKCKVAAGDDVTAAVDDVTAAVDDVTAAGDDVTAAGEDDVTAAGDDVTAAGDDVTAAGDDVTAAGDDVTAAGDDDVTAAGDDVTAAGDDVTAAGDDVTAAVDDVTVAGDDVTAAGDDVTAAGDDVTAAGDDVTAAGDDVTAAVDDVTVAGDDVTAAGDDVTAAGDDVTAAGDDVTAAGDDVTAAVDDVTAAVDDVTAAGDDVTAAVDDVTAAGDDVTAAGDDVTAAVDDVTAAGDDVTAAGDDVTIF